MAKFINVLANAIDLGSVGYSLKISECRHKLVDTYLFLNGKLVFINEASGNYCGYTDGQSSHTLSWDDPVPSYWVATLCNIDSGVYEYNGFYTAFIKRVKKYYKKSFSPEAYHINKIHIPDERSNPCPPNYFTIPQWNKCGIYYIKPNIRYMTSVIGIVGRGGKVDTHPVYESTIAEAINSGTIKI